MEERVVEEDKEVADRTSDVAVHPIEKKTLTETRKRNQVDRRYMDSVNIKMEEWYKKTKMPAVCLGLRQGKFWCATGMPQLGAFVSDPVVQEAFFRHYNAGQSKNIATLPAVPPERPEYRKCKVRELRKMVVTALISDGRQKPGWNKQHLKPVWWPEQMSFTDVNNNPRPRHHQLVTIMERYRDWQDKKLNECTGDSTHAY